MYTGTVKKGLIAVSGVTGCTIRRIYLEGGTPVGGHVSIGEGGYDQPLVISWSMGKILYCHEPRDDPMGFLQPD
jgi:hypothetical protein